MNKKKLLQELIKLQNLDNPLTIFSLLEYSPEFSYFLFEEKDTDYIEYLQWLVNYRTKYSLYSGNDYKYWFIDIARLCGFYYDNPKWKHKYNKELEIENNDGDIALYFSNKAIVCLYCQDNNHCFLGILGVKIISTEVEFLDEILKL